MRYPMHSIIAFFITCNSLAAGGVEYLTVDESMKLLDARPVDPDPNSKLNNLLWRVNPKIKADLTLLLRDQNEQHYWVMANQLLGYIADASDVPEIKSFIFRKSGKLGADDAASVASAIRALAVMTYRGIPEAKSELLAMMHPSYWSEVKFDLVSVRSQDYPSTAALLCVKAYRWTAYSGTFKKEELNSLKEKMLENLEEKDRALINRFKWLLIVGEPLKKKT